MHNNQSGDEALKMLSNTYQKILRINLTTDSHEDLKLDDSEITPEKGFSENISQWLTGFAETGQVHPNDREAYLLFTNINSLREQFRSGKTYLCCHYRRRTGNQFRWASMELIPCSEYTAENQLIFLYVKDIHN